MSSLTSRKISFGAATDAELSARAAEHNAMSRPDRHVSDDVLRRVYRRGAHTYSASHRPGMTRSEWAMARVDAFMRLLSTGRPSNPMYTSDNDLLPQEHPRYRPSSVAASAAEADELSVSIPEENTFSQPEDAVLALTEFMGLGYDAEAAVRAAWMRGIRNGDNAYRRASMIASLMYESLDADLLPELMEGGES